MNTDSLVNDGQEIVRKSANWKYNWENISHRMPFAAGKYYMRFLLEISLITQQNVLR